MSQILILAICYRLDQFLCIAPEVLLLSYGMYSVWFLSDQYLWDRLNPEIARDSNSIWENPQAWTMTVCLLTFPCAMGCVSVACSIGGLAWP